MAAFGGSKFRHTKGAMYPKDRWYTEISPSQTSDANVISVSDSHLAVVLATNGGGDVGTLPLEVTGKRKDVQMNVIHAHAGRQIFDVQYSPFDATQLATCADDGCIKLWNVADGSEVKSLNGHPRRCEVIRFNPAAMGVLASGSIDKTACIWDLETGQSALTLQSKGSIEGLSWNFDGSLLVSTGNDKTVRVWDPRKETAVAAGECHLGVKAQRVVWLGNTNKFFTTGLSKFREREFAIWDASDLSKPLKRSTIDSSTGVLIPLVDPDTNIIYLSGKGDSSVRSYEMTDDKNYYKELQGVSFSSGFKCIALAPKRIMNVMDCEVNRVFAVTNDAVAPISYTVPRKNKVDFQADLFPDTNSQTSNGITTSDWFAGKSAPPARHSMEPNRFVEKREEKIQMEVKKKEEAKANEWKPKVLTGIVRSTHYRHSEGKEAWKRDHYTNVKADCSTRDTNPIAANEKYFAVPWAGPGGRLAVIPQKRTGKLPDNGGFGMIETGSAILDFAFHPHDDNLLVTGNENAHAYIWKLDENLMDLKDNRGRAINYTGGPLVDLKGHYSKVTFTSFHPTAKDVLLTSSLDGTLKFWDTSVGAEKFTLENTIEDLIQSVDWNWDGSLMAFSSHDRKVKIVDPRGNKVVQEAVTHQGSIGVKLAWMGNTHKIITSGFGKSADRELGLWDSRKMDAPLAPFFMVDQAQALLTPYYDHDHRVLWLAAKGDGTIPFFEVVDEAPFFHYLNKYPTNVPQMGVARLPKRKYDVKNAEICRLLKLTVDTVIPVSFTVPRTRKEFFQDDIYCPTWDEKHVMSAGEWFGGSTKARKTVDLKPSGMTPLSQAPAIERVAKYKFDPNAPVKQSETSYLSSFYDKMVSVKTEGGAAAQDEKEKQRVDQFNVNEEEMEWDEEDWDEAY